MISVLGEPPSIAVLLAAVVLDFVFGELPSAVHPVVWMGKLAVWLERRAPARGARAQLAAGAGIALAVPTTCALLSTLIDELHAWPSVLFAANVVLLKSMFAARGLGRAAFRVRDALASGRLSDARLALRSLCSRDPAGLGPSLLVAATVESLAENTSDSFVAPLFYYTVFGLPGAVFYRAVNTLDSMIGYRGHYEHLGKAAARLDDVLNAIPARISALLVIVAGALRGHDARNGWSVWRRDSRKTASPNAGHPMAAMAGVLGVELEKVGCYRLGDPDQALDTGTIENAWRVALLGMAGATALALLALGAAHA